MAIKLTYEQAKGCIPAIKDVMDNGYTERTCPICGRLLKVSVSGYSGDVQCENGCFEIETIRGL